MRMFTILKSITIIFTIFSCSPLPKIANLAKEGKAEEMCKYTKHDKPGVVKYTLEKLGKLKNNKSATLCLLESLQGANPTNTKIILDGLKGRERYKEIILKKLEEYILSNNEYDMEQIIYYMADNNKIPTEHLKSRLIKLTNNNNIGIALSATRALLKYKLPVKISPIEKGLFSDFILTRRKAAKLIKYVPNGKDKDSLLSIIANESDREIQGIYFMLRRK